jgi:hypothetical protein
MVDVKDAEGKDLGSKSFQFAPHGHDAFTLNSRFTGPQNFMGSVSITGQTSKESVYKPVIWTVGSESGAFATLNRNRLISPRPWQKCVSLCRNILELRTLLREDPVKSKVVLARHIGQLKLTPKASEEGPVYEVDGALDLLNGNDVMPLVARDGIGTSTSVDST